MLRRTNLSFFTSSTIITLRRAAAGAVAATSSTASAATPSSSSSTASPKSSKKQSSKKSQQQKQQQQIAQVQTQVSVQQQQAPSSPSSAKKHLARRIAPRIQHEGNERDEAEDEPKLRVGVLLPHNEGTWEVDDIRCNPSIFTSDELKKHFVYETFTIRKQSAYKQLRQITSEDSCDAFWNLCDGAREESRTGEDTVKILESLNVPFTGADSQGFEPSKIEMKMLLAAAGIKTPNFAVLDRSDLIPPPSSGMTKESSSSGGCGGGGGDDDDSAMLDVGSTAAAASKAKAHNEGIIKACSHLRFPVIVKHISGYGSVGITKDSKCETMAQLIKKVKKFVKDFDVALVEEFVIGEEGTVFVCGDEASPIGCHVFPPLMIPVPGGPNEFLFFDKKWKDLKALGDLPSAAEVAADNVSDKYHFLEKGKPLTDKIEKMAANAFMHIMHGVGYGRCDFRIDHVTKEPLFLEINPNCGIFLPNEETGTHIEGSGDFADMMIEQEWGHDKFIRSQIEIAMKQQRARIPWWTHSYSSSAGSFLTKAARSVPRLTRVFGDIVRPVPVVCRTLYDCTVKHNKLADQDSSTRVGCVISRADMNTNNSVMLQHSCQPNCALVHSNTVELATIRAIAKGEKLTVDYATLRDGNMPTFRCSCGAENCRGIVKSQAPKVRGEKGDKVITSGFGHPSSTFPSSSSSTANNKSSVSSSSSSSASLNKNTTSSSKARPVAVVTLSKKSLQQSAKVENEGFETEVSGSNVKSTNHNADQGVPTSVVTRKMLKKRKKALKALRQNQLLMQEVKREQTTKTQQVNGGGGSSSNDAVSDSSASVTEIEAEGKSTIKK